MTGIINDSKLFGCTTTYYDKDDAFIGAKLLYKERLTRTKLFESVSTSLKMASKCDHSLVSFRIKRDNYSRY
jgi:hypothetical protein